MGKAKRYVELDPPIEAEAVHTRSGLKRQFTLKARWGAKVETWWGQGVGMVVFDLTTGYGASEARDWRLTVESVRLVLGDPTYTLRMPERDETGRPKVYAKARTPNSDGQSSFDDIAWSTPKPMARSLPPARAAAPTRPICSAFQAKAHAWLMREGACCSLGGMYE